MNNIWIVVPTYRRGLFFDYLEQWRRVMANPGGGDFDPECFRLSARQSGYSAKNR